MAIYYNGKEVGNVELSVNYELANDNIWIQDTEPEDAPEGTIWIDTSTETNVDIEVDAEMSATSENPVQNKVVKSYVDTALDVAKDFTDSKLAQMVALVENKNGVVSATITGLTNYDLLVYYAQPAPDANPVSGTIPIKGLKSFYADEIPVNIANSVCWTLFHFHNSGFYTKNYSSDGQGRIFALYGITFPH